MTAYRDSEEIPGRRERRDEEEEEIQIVSLLLGEKAGFRPLAGRTEGRGVSETMASATFIRQSSLLTLERNKIDLIYPVISGGLRCRSME